MVRETIGGSAFRVKNPATAKKDKEMDAITGVGGSINNKV